MLSFEKFKNVNAAILTREAEIGKTKRGKLANIYCYIAMQRRQRRQAITTVTTPATVAGCCAADATTGKVTQIVAASRYTVQR